jgi:hypothetical protein
LHTPLSARAKVASADATMTNKGKATLKGFGLAGLVAAPVCSAECRDNRARA